VGGNVSLDEEMETLVYKREIIYFGCGLTIVLKLNYDGN